MTRLRTALLTVFAVKGTALLINALRFPRLDRAAAHDHPGVDLSEVSVCVPARDEAARIADCLGTLVGQGVGEILVLDDESSDDTAHVASAALEAAPEGTSTRVLAGAGRPAGWVGKTWAGHQLSQAARGAVMVFVDADVRLGEGAVTAALTQMRAQEAEVFSVFPRQQTASLGERLLVPCIDDVLLTLLPHPLLRVPVSAAATASGAFLMFTRESYDRLGGFAAVRTELVEDVALARRTRRLGMRLGLALGGDLVSVRMYTTYAEVVAGFGRGLVPVVGSRALLVLGWAGHVVLYTVPPMVWLVTCRRFWLLLTAFGMAERLAIEAMTGRRQWANIPLVPAIAPAAWPVVRQAMRDVQTWRGDTYR